MSENKKEKKPFYKKTWFKIIAGIFIIMVLMEIISPSDKNDVKVENTEATESVEKTEKTESVEKTEKTEEETEKEEDYIVSDLEVEEDEFALYVKGVLKNNTDKDMSYVQVQIPIYDAEGNKLQDALANVNNLKAGDSWKFKAMFFGEMEEGLQADFDQIEITGY